MSNVSEDRQKAPEAPSAASLSASQKGRPPSWLQQLASALATVFGIGYLKPGPGTWGSVAATLVWLAAALGLHPTPPVLAATTLAAALMAVALGIPAATLVERQTGGTDPQHVVLDEVAGQWLALVPAAFAVSHIALHALAALALFRLFDITKPPPARQLERLHGGAGIMLDDIAAGAYAAFVFLLIQHWW